MKRSTSIPDAKQRWCVFAEHERNSNNKIRVRWGVCTKSPLKVICYRARGNLEWWTGKKYTVTERLYKYLNNSCTFTPTQSFQRLADKYLGGGFNV